MAGAYVALPLAVARRSSPLTSISTRRSIFRLSASRSITVASRVSGLPRTIEDIRACSESVGDAGGDSGG
jgi:hypothetical protein